LICILSNLHLRFGSNSHRGFQAESEYGFSGNAHAFASGDSLGGSSGSGSGDGPDGRSPAPARNGTKDGSEYGTSSDEFRRARVRSHPFLAFLNNIGSLDAITATFNGDGIEIEREFGFALHFALGANGPHD
jgi:hypothetical protein